MNPYKLALAATLAVSLLTGCGASKKMSFGNDADTASSTTPVFIMTATFKNDYKTSYQPKLYNINLEKRDAKNDTEAFDFDLDDKALDEQDTPEYGNRYFLRMGLSEGEYVLKGFTGYSGTFPVRGSFSQPFNAKIKSLQPGVYYLGHLSATLRESKSGEAHAGFLLPLIDQAVTGFSGGTFDLDVSDRLEADLPELKKRFPALQSATIQKNIISTAPE